MYSGSDKMAVGEVGTLKSVERRGVSLTITIDYDGREHLGTLQWDVRVIAIIDGVVIMDSEGR